MLLEKPKRNHIKENITRVHGARGKIVEVDEKPTPTTRCTQYDSVKPKVTEHMKVIMMVHNSDTGYFIVVVKFSRPHSVAAMESHRPIKVIILFSSAFCQ